MNLLIVEDEVRLCNSLARHIPWEDHGIEVVGMASNGIEALAQIERKKPDLLLADIQMPEMDGLTLARRVQESDPLIKTVILSGHDSFAYAQTAVELSVFKYLLKPAGDTEILQAVLGAAQQLRVELEERHERGLLKYKWEQHLPYLHNEFYIQLLRGRYRPDEIIGLSMELDLNLQPDERYVVVVFDMDRQPEQESGSYVKDASLLQHTLAGILQDRLPDSAYRMCSDMQGLSVVLFAVGEREEETEAVLRVHTTAAKVLALIEDYMKHTASAGISGGAGRAGVLHVLYREACTALLNRKLLGGGIAIPYRESVPRAAIVSCPEPTYEKALEMAFQTGDEDKALAALISMWEEGQNKLVTLDDMHEYVLCLSSTLIRLIRKQGWLVKEVTGEDFVFFQNNHLLATAEQIYAWLQNTIHKMLAYARSQRQIVSHQTVKTILDLVEQELDTDLTLHTVAERLYVNSSYLSRLFKQETGKPFSTYVLERKMERARSVLQEGDKVYNAALAAGYRDVSYFTKVFRKYWGVTPGSFKL
ncbi:response regulator [Paenibacillus sp. SYP-B3998]|uniref:Response regulator n=1 Tax=Paenibacillus sp. SYP-B3998 TaxID=2678564 RepID=A0A6G3ZWK3_9BACL|nr:response regulator [Paenibacillus sp. SYP-B3998]NEW05797.1 response regulator [Paenibacillus sp. SYP-B3998]